MYGILIAMYHGDYHLWSRLFGDLLSFFRLETFSSVILLKTFSVPLTWISFLSSHPITQKLGLFHRIPHFLDVLCLVFCFIFLFFRFNIFFYWGIYLPHLPCLQCLKISLLYLVLCWRGLFLRFCLTSWGTHFQFCLWVLLSDLHVVSCFCYFIHRVCFYRLQT